MSFIPELGGSVIHLIASADAASIHALGASAIRTFELCPGVFANDAGGEVKALFRQMLHASGKRVASWHVPYGEEYDLSSPDETCRRQAVDHIREQIAEAEFWGCQILVVHPGPEPFPQSERSPRQKRVARSVCELHAALQKAGLRLALELLPRQCLGRTVEELFAMLEGAEDTCGICLDVNHFMAAYREIPDAVRRCGNRLLTLHLSDYDGIDERHWIPAPGRGVVCWQELFQALSQIGYQGTFNLECRMPKDMTTVERVALWEDSFGDFLLPAYYAAGAVPLERRCDSVLCAEQRNCEILLLNWRKGWSRPQSVLWRWSPLDDDAIAAAHKGWYQNFSDCKCVMRQTHVLAVASGGAVSLIRIADRKVVFYAYAGGNTHSAALLPDGNIACASSSGNFITIFVRPTLFTGPENVKSVTVEYRDAHGVVWDHPQKLLWVLGHDRLASFRYNADRELPELTMVDCFRPSDDDFIGHDLIPVPHTQSLYLTGHRHVLRFDTVSHEISPCFSLHDVKSISEHPASGGIIMQIPEEQWWSDTLVTDRGVRQTLPGARFYKARWFVDNELTDSLPAQG